MTDIGLDNVKPRRTTERTSEQASVSAVREQAAFYLTEDLNGNHKLRGGYYTPYPIAAFLCDWAVEPASEVLEPSAGDGVIVEAAARRTGDEGRVVAVELYADEAAKARRRAGPRGATVTGDFFSWFKGVRPENAFDAVVGNPPFIRYHDFAEDHRRPAFELLREEGLKPTRLTNAWMPFVVVGARALREGGRLAMVLPAELLQVGYAADLREYLVRKFAELTVVTFRQLVFDSIQQEVVLLLGVKGESKTAKMRFVELGDATDLASAVESWNPPVEIDLTQARSKWTRFYLSSSELALLNRLERGPDFAQLGQLAEVDVGIVTGRNEFFVLTESEAASLGLLEWCLPLVSRSSQLPGVILEEDHWKRILADGGKCLLLQLGDLDRRELMAAALRYVEYGETQSFHEKYKCKIRLPRWWSVPSVWVPDAFLLRQIHDGPRIIKNEARATCTDTIHRVRMRKGKDVGRLAAAAVNSVTFAFAEVLGRSYGGGVLELEPREAEVLPVPPERLPVDAAEIDTVIRSTGIEAALDLVDSAIVANGIVSAEEMRALRGVWLRLSDRRRKRKRKPGHSA